MIRRRTAPTDVDVTTEAYPYTAGSTSIQSTIFDDGLARAPVDFSYGDVQWEDDRRSASRKRPSIAIRPKLAAR